jgi:hypothetical protein
MVAIFLNKDSGIKPGTVHPSYGAIRTAVVSFWGKGQGLVAPDPARNSSEKGIRVQYSSLTKDSARYFILTDNNS